MLSIALRHTLSVAYSYQLNSAENKSALYSAENSSTSTLAQTAEHAAASPRRTAKVLRHVFEGSVGRLAEEQFFTSTTTLPPHTSREDYSKPFTAATCLTCQQTVHVQARLAVARHPLIQVMSPPLLRWSHLKLSNRLSTAMRHTHRTLTRRALYRVTIGPTTCQLRKDSALGPVRSPRSQSYATSWRTRSLTLP